MGQQDPVPLQQGADPRGPLHLAVLLSFSGAGGVERMVMNLVRELAAMPGLRLDLLSIRADGPHLTAIPANVRWLPLQAGHTLTAIPALVRYLCREKPQALLVAKDRAGRAALMARQLAGVDCRVVIRLGTNLSAALKNRSGIRRWWRTLPMRWLYPLVDRVVAVSDGVARDTVAITGLPAARVTVIRNPVITPGLLAQAQAPVAHPWLNLKTVPVIMGAGRLSDQKDFLTLLEAFAQVRRQRDCRLMI
nr:glycosyltransferase [Thiolinea sp.]